MVILTSIRYKLAQLNTMEENYPETLESLQQAQKIAEREKLFNELRRINCLIGVAQGTMHFGAYANHVLQEMRITQESK